MAVSANQVDNTWLDNFQAPLSQKFAARSQNHALQWVFHEEQKVKGTSEIGNDVCQGLLVISICFLQALQLPFCCN